jgi:two-component system response regulator ResD
VPALEINEAERTVRVDGTLVMLRRREYQLLVHLAAEPTRVFTKRELFRDVWGLASPHPDSRAVDSAAARVRHALAAAGLDGAVRNVWGVGYRLSDPVENPTVEANA